MQFSEWVLLALSCFIGASSPGPSIALMIRALLRDGRIAGLVFACCHGFGIMLYAGLVSTGIIAVMMVMPGLMTALQILGVMFLFYVSQGMIRGGINAKKTEQNPQSEQNLEANDLKAPALPKSLIAHGRDGFLIVFLNPKVAAFFLAIFSQFLHSDQSILTRIGMTLLAWGIDTGWYIVMAFVLAIPMVLNQLRRHHGMVEAAMGGLLMLAAIAMLMRMVLMRMVISL